MGRFLQAVSLLFTSISGFQALCMHINIWLVGQQKLLTTQRWSSMANCTTWTTKTRNLAGLGSSLLFSQKMLLLATSEYSDLVSFSQPLEATDTVEARLWPKATSLFVVLLRYIDLSSFILSTCLHACLASCEHHNIKIKNWLAQCIILRCSQNTSSRTCQQRHTTSKNQGKTNTPNQKKKHPNTQETNPNTTPQNDRKQTQTPPKTTIPWDQRNHRPADAPPRCQAPLQSNDLSGRAKPSQAKQLNETKPNTTSNQSPLLWTRSTSPPKKSPKTPQNPKENWKKKKGPGRSWRCGRG